MTTPEDHQMSETTARTCTKTPCEHSEARSPMFSGHCSHASCPNYMDACSVHENYGLGEPRPAGRTGR